MVMAYCLPGHDDKRNICAEPGWPHGGNERDWSRCRVAGSTANGMGNPAGL